MAFLTVNGFTLAIADGSFEETPREIGSVTTAFSGAMRKSRRALKRDIRVETLPMIPSEAYAWEQLLSGQGEYWSFDSSLYSSKGTGVTSSPHNLIATGGKYAGYIQPGGIDIVMPAGLGAQWSYLGWRIAAGPTYISTVETSAGAKWVSGVRNDATVLSTQWVVSGGNLTFKSTGSWLDEVLALPFVIPDAWGAAWHTAGAAAGPLPFVRLAGDGIPEGARTALPAVVGSSTLRGSVGGVFYPNLRSLSLEFSEA